MRSRFDEQLALLNKDLIEMGAMCEEVIALAAKALLDGDPTLAAKVAPLDTEIDQMERDIESMCLKLLLQQQPVARDLRQISAALKMITDMERIGDHAADISEMTIMMDKASYPEQLEDIKKMASETVLMLIRSIEAYVEKNMEKARKVIASDDTVDDLFDRNKNDIIDMIHKDPSKGEQAVDLLMIAKYFERIGDHATNIAEWVIFALDDKKTKTEA